MIEEILGPLSLTSDASIKLRTFWRWLDAQLAALSIPQSEAGERERLIRKAAFAEGYSAGQNDSRIGSIDPKGAWLASEASALSTPTAQAEASGLAEIERILRLRLEAGREDDMVTVALSIALTALGRPA
jgi:hypothetical protein